jgi:uncharacterized protein
MFLIRELIVSAAQEEHIWVEHRVTPEEVEEVCFSDPLVIRGRDGSYAVYGQTEAGRYLIAFLNPRGRGIFSLATAREMEQRERRRYLEHRRE